MNYTCFVFLQPFTKLLELLKPTHRTLAIVIRTIFTVIMVVLLLLIVGLLYCGNI